MPTPSLSARRPSGLVVLAARPRRLRQPRRRRWDHDGQRRRRPSRRVSDRRADEQRRRRARRERLGRRGRERRASAASAAPTAAATASAKAIVDAGAPADAGSKVVIAKDAGSPADAGSTAASDAGAVALSPAAALAKQIDAIYAGKKTFSAKFKQEYVLKVSNTTKSSSGVVFIERPNKISFRYDAPNKNRIVSDGTTLKVYIAEDNQMIEKPVEKSQYPGAFGFLMGNGISSSFTFTINDKAVYKDGPVLQGKPTSPTPDYEAATFFINKEKLDKSDPGAIARVSRRRPGEQEPLRSRGRRAAGHHRSERVHLHRAGRHQHHPLSTMAFWKTFGRASRRRGSSSEDEDVILVDKPAGVSTHAPEPDRTDDAHTRLTEYLRARGAASTYLGIHQRLDRDTSGVLLFTRRKEANRAVAEQFEGRTIEKTYVAGVTGLGKRERGVLEHRIVPGQGGVMRALPKTSRVGQEAVTRYRVLDRKGDRGLLELTPETGRTHQIRVQLAAEGMPIVGDPLYGGAPSPRLLLHASELRLAHPTSKKKLVGRSPAPPAFAEWLSGAPDPLRSTRSIAHALRFAAELRYNIAKSQGTTAFRIVNGGGDGLPGVTVDVYGEWLVVALTSPRPRPRASASSTPRPRSARAGST